MKSVLKKIAQTVLFVICTLVIPFALLLMFVDSTSRFAVYVFVFGVIIFAILGYIIISVRSMSKELHNAVEEMKMQNAAIAFKLTSGMNDIKAEEVVVEPKVEEKPKKVNLNPADPLDFN